MKKKLYLIFLLWAAALLALSTTFVQNTYAGDGFFSNIKRFGNHTYVGPFDISNHSRKKAKEKLAGDFAGLQENVVVSLVYQDQTVELPHESVMFDVDETLALAESGQDNGLAVSIARESLQTVLQQHFTSLSFPEEAVEAIARGTEDQLQTGIMPQSIHIADYLPDAYAQAETVASSSYKMNELTKGLTLLINTLDGLEIGPNSSFSLLEFVKENELEVSTDNDLTILASVLYAAALQTNWIIDERNIGSELTKGVEPGFEAAINRKLGLDFAFSNPNKSKFTLHMNGTSSQLALSVEGLPFYYTYEPIVDQLKTFKPKTVYRYSAFVPAGRVEVLDQGKDAMEVEVIRNLKVDGFLEDVERVSSDFYAPRPKVERRHLIQPETPAAGDPTTDGGSTPQDGDGTTDGQSGSGGNTTTGNTDKKETSGSGSGSKTEQTEKEKVQYDKGGNPIKFDKNGNPIDR